MNNYYDLVNLFRDGFGSTDLRVSGKFERPLADLNVLRALCKYHGIRVKGLTTNLIDEDGQHDPYGDEFYSSIEVYTNWDKDRMVVSTRGSRRERHNQAKIQWLQWQLLNKLQNQ